MKIGFVTIGQSPRPDLLEPFHLSIDDATEADLTGALDDLTSAEVSELFPVNGEEPLLTRLRNGSSVTIAKERILPLMQQRINEHQNAGCDVIVILCTGPFPELTAQVPMLMTDTVLSHFVQGVLPAGKLGVIAPLADQESMMRDKWRSYPSLHLEFLDPYHGDPAKMEMGGLQGCDIVILDCMGYTAETKRAVREHLDVPVVVAQEVLAGSVGLLV